MMLRLGHLMLALAGLLVVLGLAILGRDARRAGAAGPRWRRRLVAAGLGLLAALGFAPVAPRAAEPKVAQRPEGLESSKEWNELQALAKEAEEIAADQRGAFPFSENEKAQLLARLEAARGKVDALVGDGLLGRVEGELFLRRLEDLRARVQRFRPKEMERATCYKPMPIPDRATGAWARLRERLPLARQLVEAKTVDRRVLAKVVAGLKEDRDELAQGKSLSAEQRRALAEMTAAIRALEKKL